MMRSIAVLGMICAMTQTASAGIGDCSTIADPTAQLACYNNEAPPPAGHASAAKRSSAAKPRAAAPDGSKRVDQPSDEDAAVDAKMRSLCRGC
jgi:hypothetical protein